MRWFRVPAFSGIQAAADDADRGTLRIAEGCLPVGTGGLHSGPVWEDIGTVDSKSSDSNNILTGVDDAAGNSVLLASRFDQVHDVKVFPVANTELLPMDPCYDVSVGTLYNEGQAYLSAVGNRLVAFGDGASEALFAGQGSPVGSSGTFPDAKIYHLEYSRFPNCRFFVVGPHKTLFAGGNPSNPLTIYISEPAGLTQPERDSLYSLEATSSVNLLMTDASEVTALSCVAGNVAAHTDAGIFLLSPPTPDQASTGYRVEQAPTSVASAAVNLQVVAGEDGTQPYYLGFDGQIWKDPQGPGCEQKATYTDPVQASASAKGRWDVEHPTDLSNSFAAYEPEIGQYWVYVESDEWTAWRGQFPPAMPYNLRARTNPHSPADLVGALVPFAPSDLTEVVPLHAPWMLIASTNPEAPADLLAIPSLGAPSDLDALTLPGSPIDLSATTRPRAPIDLNAATIPGAPFNLTGAATIPAPSDLLAVTDLGAPFNLTGEAAIPAPSDLLAVTDLGAPFNLTGEATIPAPSDLVAATDLGAPFNLTGDLGLVSPDSPSDLDGDTDLGAPSDLVSPMILGEPRELLATTLPGEPSDLGADASLGSPSDLLATTLPGVPQHLYGSSEYGAPSDLLATTFPGEPADLVCNTFSLGSPSDLLATTLPGAPSDLESPMVLGKPMELLANTAPGEPSDLLATPALGAPYNFGGTTDLGAPSDLFAPTAPGAPYNFGGTTDLGAPSDLFAPMEPGAPWNFGAATAPGFPDGLFAIDSQLAPCITLEETYGDINEVTGIGGEALYLAVAGQLTAGSFMNPNYHLLAPAWGMKKPVGTSTEFPDESWHTTWAAGGPFAYYPYGGEIALQRTTTQFPADYYVLWAKAQYKGLRYLSHRYYQSGFWGWHVDAGMVGWPSWKVQQINKNGSIVEHWIIADEGGKYQVVKITSTYLQKLPNGVTTSCTLPTGQIVMPSGSLAYDRPYVAASGMTGAGGIDAFGNSFDFVD